MASKAAPPESLEASALFAPERIVAAGGAPYLIRFRRGADAQPLVAALPGGGHLARVFYGHPGAAPDDFLLNHLEAAGFSTLALSYPTSHPALKHPLPGMTIAAWSAGCAEIIAATVAREGLPARVIVAAWSLGGRLARNLAVDLRRHGIAIDLFAGLSAAPPLPGFGSLAPAALALTAAGLRDDSSAASSIFRSREAQLAVIDRINGRTVLPRDVYARHYVADSPINFRGEAERYDAGALVSDIGAAVIDQGSFDFENYPLCGAIAARDPADARFALTSAQAFGMLNTQSLYARMIKPALAAHSPDAAAWTALCRLMDGLTARMSRHVDGSHFFFIGARGARETARNIIALADEAADVRREIATLLH